MKSIVGLVVLWGCQGGATDPGKGPVAGHTGVAPSHTGVAAHTGAEEHTGDSVPGHTAADVHTGVGHTGVGHTGVGHTGAPVPTGHTGVVFDPWALPAPANGCDVPWVGASAPGPVVDADAIGFLYRVQGEDHFNCGFAVATLPDGDGDGSADLAVGCALLSPGGAPEIWWLDGTQRGEVERADASGVVVFSDVVASLLDLSVGEGSTGAAELLVATTAPRDMWGAPQPLPRGEVLSDDVRDFWITPYGSGSGIPSDLRTGDFDGDGVVDVVASGRNPFVSEPVPTWGEGGVNVYLGPVSGRTRSDSAWATYEVGDIDIVWSVYHESQSGEYQPILYDFDGDGWLDVLMGGEDILDFAPVTAGGMFDHQGGAVLFLGDGTPGRHSLADAQAVVYGSCQPYLGVIQDVVGDVTGDGFVDVAMGGHGASMLDYETGAVFLFSNLWATEGYRSAATAEAIVLGEAAGDQLSMLGALGDLNGDGFDDLILGSTWGADNGRAYIFLGPVTGVVNAADADLVIHGGQRDEFFGEKVGSAGDVDQDGVIDVYVSAQNSWWGGGRDDEGAVYVFSGAALLAEMVP